MHKEIENLVLTKLAAADPLRIPRQTGRVPVHVVYGGAHLFNAGTPAKLGAIAIRSLETYAPDFCDFARAMWLDGSDNLPRNAEGIQDLEFSLADDPEKAGRERPEALFAWRVFRKTIEKLKFEPVEDFRIDFEDGYGIRTDEEEDGHCISTSKELANLVFGESVETGAPSTGFRIKSLQPETRHRALRTFDLFLSNLLEFSGGRIPDGFVVTLPKIKSPSETKALSMLLDAFESENGLENGVIGIEILIETPESIPLIREIAEACNGRCRSAHFGAYDYTSSFGIAGVHQHIRHNACEFARNVMQVALSPLGIRLCDSVTTEMPIPIHRDGNLSIEQIAENRKSVREAWRKHFNNITHSQMNGFFQSWDLHPAQLVARYAAVYSYFLGSFEPQAKRLQSFLDKATQAVTTGNVFDDLASAEGLLNFFVRGHQSGAFTVKNVSDATGLTGVEINSASFAEIMSARFSRSASS